MRKRKHGIRAESSFADVPFCGASPFVGKVRFEIGDVYLFHRRNPYCPAESSLWGLFDKRVGSSIYLESSTKDFRHFKTWHRLSDRYRYCRRSTRSEFRDYVVNRTVSEMFELPGRKRCYLPQECPGKRGRR